MQEIWVKTNQNSSNEKTVIEFSNFGNIKRKDGTIEASYHKQRIKVNGISQLVYRHIADNFLPKTVEDVEMNRTVIDHITHNPIDININDVRNLRWCTQKENCNFAEATSNASKAHRGLTSPRKGIILDEATKRKMSDAHKGQIPWNKGLSHKA